MKMLSGPALTFALASTLIAGSAHAQAVSNLSAQDKQFLHELGEDSNFEMASAKLALQKSSSADVKSYAQMVLADHRRLQQQTNNAARKAQVSPVSPDGMSVSEHAEILKLKVLSGSGFDEAYIRGLIKGNEDIQKLEKAEATGSSVAYMKKLGEDSTAIDTKHADKAKNLAATHHIQS